MLETCAVALGADTVRMQSLLNSCIWQRPQESLDVGLLPLLGCQLLAVFRCVLRGRDFNK
jgi:hypothetical protein